MKALDKYKLDTYVKDVVIEVFGVDKAFLIEGFLMEGYITNHRVLDTDKLCLRYAWHLRDFIDVEIYAPGRFALYRLTNLQFSKIKNWIVTIN